jgi:CysZ protein
LIAAFAKSFAQLSDPPIRAVIWKSVCGTLLIFGVLLSGAGWVLTNTSLFDIAWVEAVMDVFGGLAAVLLALILFPGAMAALVSILLEDVADAVEGRHYPGLGSARTLSWGLLLAMSLRLIGMTLLLNFLALPFYLIPGANLVVYYGLNGYLLSREYFEVVALRRLNKDQARALWRRFRGRLWLAGAATTVLLTIPILNMIAPVIGTAAMVHLFHRVDGGH